VIGINRYAEWPLLFNAVNDAERAMQRFKALGFEPAGEPLFDDAATTAALHRLVVDDMAKTLDENDSLVVFFAGHGTTRTLSSGGAPVTNGYIIPVDARASDEHVVSWLRLDQWLSNVARLPPRHILVILDACHTGIALDALIKRYRGFPSDPLAELRTRRSRRVITSALGNQQALDGGPIPGHSLFTGCLLEALDGKVVRNGAWKGAYDVTGTELGQYLQNRVTRHSDGQQTPDFGAFEHDDRGELVLSLQPPDVAPGCPSAVEAAPEPSVSMAREFDELSLEILVMSSVDEREWSAVPWAGRVPADSKIRTVVRAQARCWIALVAEPLMIKQRFDLRLLTPSAEPLQAGEWRQIPQGSLLVEQDPQRTTGWTLYFIVGRADDRSPLEIRNALSTLAAKQLSRQKAAARLASLLPAKATPSWRAVETGLQLSWGLPAGDELMFVRARPPFVVSHRLRFS
jgi:hypothetical protein